MAASRDPGSEANKAGRRSAAETRDHVLAVAGQLFYWEGIRATGIDRVASEAEVAPTTLYRAFASKDDLIAAYIDAIGETHRELIMDATATSVGTPRQRILSLLDFFAEQIQPEKCRGCPFLMAIAEFPDPTSPVHVGAVAHKAWLRNRLRQLTRELAEETPIADPDLLGDQIALVVEGVYASVQSISSGGPALQGGSTAETLIDAAERGP
jgi:AcrR family transcriptional regulator